MILNQRGLPVFSLFLMKIKSWRFLFINILYLYILLVLGGCGAKTTIILLPETNGKVGHLIVKNDGGTVDLKQARQATFVQGKQAAPSRPEVLTKEEIEANFRDALAALPEQPEHFILYFLKNSNRLTKDSRELLGKILVSIDVRHSRKIKIYGHSDTAGNKQYNLKLSKERAKTVANLLIELGVNPDYISATSHGESNPLIETADNTFEQRNRRVEVVIK